MCNRSSQRCLEFQHQAMFPPLLRECNMPRLFHRFYYQPFAIGVSATRYGAAYSPGYGSFGGGVGKKCITLN